MFKKSIKFVVLFLAVSGLILLVGCGGDDASTNPADSDNPTVPALTTAAVSAITQTTAECGGNVTSDGGASVTARGVCWSINPSPTVAESKTTDGTGTGSFTSSINSLAVGTTYYVRAFATNSAGTGYGSAQSFTTLPAGGVGNWGISTHLFSDYGVSLTSDGNTMYLGGWGLKVSYRTGGTWSTPVLLPAPLDDPHNRGASVTGDGSRLYFVADRDPDTFFWYSNKTLNGWSTPEPVPINFGIGDDIFASPGSILVSWDGSTIWFSKTVNWCGDLCKDIYFSEFNGTSWTEPEPFSTVNTVEYSESTMAISGDGLVFYFQTRSRPGYSLYSIWASENIGGIWQEPVPLNSNINLSGYEDRGSPAVSFDGSEFYFGAYDHENILPSGTRVSEREP